MAGQQAAGWTVSGVGFAIVTALYQGVEKPNIVITGFLALVAISLIGYGLYLTFTRPQVRGHISVHSVNVKQTLDDRKNSIVLSLTTHIDTGNPIQLRFQLQLPDGVIIGSDEYHRRFHRSTTMLGSSGQWIDNPQVFDEGVKGPAQISFIIPPGQYAEEDLPTDDLMLCVEDTHRTSKRVATRFKIPGNSELRLSLWKRLFRRSTPDTPEPPTRPGSG